MICDLAECYHVFDYKALSPELVATLVLGLRENSRVKMKLSKSKLTIEQILMARIADDLSFVAWTYTKEARKGKPYKGKSILKALQGDYTEEKEQYEVFETIEEFEEYMKQFIE